MSKKQFSSLPFIIGPAYQTLGGKTVYIVEESTTPGYECVKGDDGIWRYNREGEFERGRVTGTDHTGTHQDNLIPIGDDGEPMETWNCVLEGPDAHRVNGGKLTLLADPDVIQTPSIVVGQPHIFVKTGYPLDGTGRTVSYRQAVVYRYAPPERDSKGGLIDAEPATE